VARSVADSRPLPSPGPFAGDGVHKLGSGKVLHGVTISHKEEGKTGVAARRLRLR